MNPASGIEPIPTSDSKPTHWLLRLIMWDGILPLIVWACPAFFRWWLQDDEVGLIIAAGIVPILALVVRYYMAIRYIERNHCGPWTKRFQTYTLRLALLYLLCLESLLITLQDLPGVNQFDLAAVLFLVTAYLIYLLPMAFVLYPGQVSSNNPTDEEVSGTRTNYFGGEESLS
jgi:hypothetical protein